MTVLEASPFVRACRGLPGPHTPVWFMRQAGRSLPEYRKIRAGVGMLESCRRPDLVTEITLQPVRRHGVDAAILFSDIVVPVAAAGIDLDIVAGTGPVVAEPIRSAPDLERLRPITPDDVDFVAESVRLLVAELGSTPLIGFAGAPFTLASYLIEGGPSRTYLKTKAMMYAQPDLWHALLGRLSEITLTFLRTQVDAGVSAVQLFDSWAGALSEADYRQYVLPHSAAVLSGLAGAGVPRIHFGVGTAVLLEAMGEAGADVVGVDWRTPLDVATKRLGPEKAVQGNLDPAILFAGWETVERETRRVLAQGAAAPGHVFNLGHGVMPETDPEILTRLVALVHEVSGRS
ncbi:putative uroporphyrinogen decarboxylase [Actinoplanes missouriensis 431]|uniref:Uroporphyrinogen decarboxylase n=1 Tax=Actinoplanes missouriensis (strain ATCC 14538 / DSM 43046 / CBS 188.64 / JCM 3121 / NBRC 102363 / NCIMB 12654 / NRRL B-3342 / UNCC 431) TaxID=512565 RepID=I0HGB3_ACTM4|nr:putative uroporphyrinogen decarboxylase [Actinoplanes missouriensis 431]